MTTAGRNDPCPCGSGKKLKRCCLAKQDAPHAAAGHYQHAIGRVLDWLMTRHRRATEQALKEFREAVQRTLGEAEESLPHPLLETLTLLATENLLAEAQISTREGPRTVWELLGEPGAPALGVEEREVLAQLASRPLRLYEIAEVDPGHGFAVVDVVSGERVEVAEQLGSTQVVPGDVAALRLLHRQHAVTLSGLVLSFRRSELQALREGLREIERLLRKSSPQERRPHVGAWLVNAWLETVVRSSRPPELVDMGTMEKITLTTDHYRVPDWQALAAALEAEPDVEGSYATEGWVRGEPHGRGTRCLLALNVGRGDRLEVFARTLGLADQGREWLQRVAGDLVVFRARDVVDPKEALRNENRARRRPPPPPLVVPAELQQEVYEQIFDGWADMPLPVLAGKTPRQALRSRLGRERVVELLLTYEHEERRQARAEKRPTVDHGFLWRSVGLERPER